MRRRSRRGGFSLLELLLAGAILLGAIAVLGELTRIGNRNASSAELLTTAQLLAESKLAEIVAGSDMAQPVSDVAFEEEPGWTYSVTAEPALRPGLQSVCVTVTQALESKKRPVKFSVTRWIRDPVSSLDENPAAATDPNATGQSTNSSPMNSGPMNTGPMSDPMGNSPMSTPPPPRRSRPSFVNPMP